MFLTSIEYGTSNAAGPTTVGSPDRISTARLCGGTASFTSVAAVVRGRRIGHSRSARLRLPYSRPTPAHRPAKVAGTVNVAVPPASRLMGVERLPVPPLAHEEPARRHARPVAECQSRRRRIGQRGARHRVRPLIGHRDRVSGGAAGQELGHAVALGDDEVGHDRRCGDRIGVGRGIVRGIRVRRPRRAASCVAVMLTVPLTAVTVASSVNVTMPPGGGVGTDRPVSN